VRAKSVLSRTETAVSRARQASPLLEYIMVALWLQICSIGISGALIPVKEVRRYGGRCTGAAGAGRQRLRSDLCALEVRGSRRLSEVARSCVVIAAASSQVGGN
jgi:hypothetical protein